jgi:hypothetical protein
MSLQLYSAPHSLEPLRLNPTAVQFAKRGTNFLAFNKPPSVEPAVEFATAQSPSWPGVWPGKLEVRDTDPELRHSFAKPGIFGFRYRDVANPVAYGSDYNIDFGPGRPGPGVVAAERMNGVAADVLDPMPPPPARQMIFTEKESALLNPPANAYRTYGYQESATWMMQRDGSRAAVERSRVMDMDPNQCSPGESLVNGFCFQGPRAQPSCPPGWQYNSADHQCHLSQERANAAAMEGVSKMRCPPGWVVSGGVCKAKENAVGGGYALGMIRKMKAKENAVGGGYALGMIRKMKKSK